MPGLLNDTGDVCCVATCPQCGGPGCGVPGEGLGPSNCCAGQILAMQEYCDITGAAPCILGGELKSFPRQGSVPQLKARNLHLEVESEGLGGFLPNSSTTAIVFVCVRKIPALELVENAGHTKVPTIGRHCLEVLSLRSRKRGGSSPRNIRLARNRKSEMSHFARTAAW